ncbi:hypothetical protein ACFU8W_46035 [Streptomyces sp. NPDC057565]|uniref:hypothetical protein n=1 Tax=Streptomyces sp. NPDC057565 TaxID=3346169 RepID=UPI0036BADF12
MGEFLQRPDSENEPSRLRRVRVPGTVPIPPAVSRRPREEEGQEAFGTGEGPEAAE